MKKLLLLASPIEEEEVRSESISRLITTALISSSVGSILLEPNARVNFVAAGKEARRQSLLLKSGRVSEQSDSQSVSQSVSRHQCVPQHSSLSIGLQLS